MGHCTMIGFGTSFRTQSFEEWAIINLVTPRVDIPQKGSLSRRGWLLRWAVTVKTPPEVPEPPSSSYRRLIEWAKENFVTTEV